MKIPDPEYLANVALNYLSRFSVSEASLRRVLESRLRCAAIKNAEFAANVVLQKKLRQAIDDLVEKHKKNGNLNDTSYAAMKVETMRRSGRSARYIMQYLKQKGVAANVMKEVLKLGNKNTSFAEDELKAAFNFARRRKLGLFREAKADPRRFCPHNLLNKDFAIMRRAGFSIDIAQKVLGKIDDEDNLIF